MEIQHYHNSKIQTTYANGTKLNILCTKSGYIYNVEQNEDGSLHIQLLTVYFTRNRIDVEDNPNAGQLINSKGGIAKVLELCQPMTDFQLVELVKNEYYEKKARRKQAEERQAQRDSEEAKKATEDFAKIAGKEVEITVDNLRIFLRCLRYGNGVGYSQGSVKFKYHGKPVGYFYSNYDCDGKLAAAIKFDHAVTIQTDFGPKTDHRFCYGAPLHYMTNYTKIGDELYRGL